MAKPTIDDCIQQARAILQDTTEPYRYSAADLVMHFNTAMLELKRIRPDAWLGSYDTDLTIYTTADVALEMPVGAFYFFPVVYFLAGASELRDDEYTADGRAASLLTAFSRQVTYGAKT